MILARFKLFEQETKTVLVDFEIPRHLEATGNALTAAAACPELSG